MGPISTVTPLTADELKALIRQACTSRYRSYTPHSHFPVGATLLCPDGSLYSGCSVENKSPLAGTHAERNALANAILAGHKSFRAIAIATEDGKGIPCEACRQALSEFSPKLVVYVVTANGTQTLHTTLDQLANKTIGQ